ncbi:MAG: hypothetical protein IJS33_05425 [Firmicutes bacterium]|nr:hypothetical protein [Bacillota bacterium]
MKLLRELSKNYKTISIVGMAKNAGKTTALNFLIEEALDEDVRLGITSTGRDGESTDLVTETEKPRVYLYEGTLVSVPRKLYELAEAGLEIISMSNYRTALGELLLCEVKSEGYVQIAGPVATADTRKLCDEMFSHGAELVLVDGAIDRKSVASPDSSDAIILSTGAVLSRDIKKVARETAHVVGLYNLPVLDDDDAKAAILPFLDENRILLLRKSDEGYDIEVLDLKTSLGAGRILDEHIDDSVSFVFIPGALTNSVIESINPSKLKKTKFILKDPTKIFIDSVTWKQLIKRGLDIKVIKNIKVCAVTVNPISPEGYSFDSNVLQAEVEKAVPGIPVIDVRK